MTAVDSFAPRRRVAACPLHVDPGPAACHGGCARLLPSKAALPAPPRPTPQLRNLGVPLSWSLMEDVRPADPRFAETPADVRYWEQARGQGSAVARKGRARNSLSSCPTKGTQMLLSWQARRAVQALLWVTACVWWRGPRGAAWCLPGAPCTVQPTGAPSCRAGGGAGPGRGAAARPHAPLLPRLLRAAAVGAVRRPHRALPQALQAREVRRAGAGRLPGAWHASEGRLRPSGSVC